MRFSSGHTPLVKIYEINRIFEMPNLFIKDESKNPFGTYKDRRSELIISEALKHDIDKLVLITSGNAGFSLARFAMGSRIKVICIVDENIPYGPYERLKSVCYKVIKIDLSNCIVSSEELISLAKEEENDHVWDVTNGMDESYESIIEEIRGENPDFLITPIGSGEAFLGMLSGIEKYQLQTTLVGVTPKNNPSFADKLCAVWTPYRDRIESISRTGRHRLIRVEEKDIKETYSLVKEYIKCEPSSAIVFSVLHQFTNNRENKIILINSGSSS